jgi:hypothetical protein
MSIEPIAAVSQVGFPIVAFILMYKFARDTVKENTKAIRELQTEVSHLNE